MKIKTLPIAQITPYARNPRTGEKVHRICEVCNKGFDIYASSLRSSNASGRFCSRACYTEFKRTLTKTKHHRYNKVDTTCSYCGTNIQVIPARIKLYSNHYCSNECRHNGHIGVYAGIANPNWRGGHIQRKGNFSTIKTIHFNKIQFCAMCGTTKRIQIHHIIPFRYTQDNSLSNLIPLCVAHHRVVEIMTWDIIDSCENTDFVRAKELLNIILRDIQFNIYKNIKRYIEKNCNG